MKIKILVYDLLREPIFYIVLAIVIGVSLLIYSGYKGDCIETDHLNSKYKTNYTCADMFWAESNIRLILNEPIIHKRY